MNTPTDTTEVIELGPNRRKLNGALEPARNATMLSLIGNPCAGYTQECQRPTNPEIAGLLETADFGPFRATGLHPAFGALQAIMASVDRKITPAALLRNWGIAYGGNFAGAFGLALALALAWRFAFLGPRPRV